MRVTQGMLATNSLRHLSQSYSNMGKYQDQLATGKKINRPSDDPVVAIKGMYYRTNLTEVEQYKRNLSEGYQWMESSESGIEHATQVIQRVRELVVQGSNGSNSPEDLKAIGVEIGQLKEDLANVANTQVAGRYIFNGTKTDSAPVTIDDSGITVDMNTDAFKVEVSNGVKLKVNINPTNVFGSELFNTLQSIEDALNSGSIESGDEFLSKIDEHFDVMSAERSEIGARYNRLEMIDTRIQDQEIIASRILSENEDADIEKVITDLTIQESIHRASLAVSSKIIQPSLIDFLR
ncbi:MULTISPECIES: flagellar hook-associated protein FlgL [Metabacillus]|uniref:Flagellar biosynthesis protein FlgL n=2 Tax=Metabacillus TaxID=2675233 RepID=A0A179SXH6_9BACI|nr:MULTISPECIES: flagellar hook-associated protein FlgL [Metabacillus]OAS85810.1 flagellar biosynthesis protein FlgL [Metabacillus litoralis]QNF27202.1 flagellar hook-associated protein FlgL [Metabacillus sp. KUDC1714]